MTKQEMTERILAAKIAKKKSWVAIAEAVGLSDADHDERQVSALQKVVVAARTSSNSGPFPRGSLAVVMPSKSRFIGIAGQVFLTNA
jgi:hypothetical protein